MMSRRNQIALLALLLVAFLYVVYHYQETRLPEAGPAGVGVTTTFVPLSVENPALRLDLLDRMKKFQYEGSQRNIFSAAPPPPPAPTAAVAVAPVAPPVPQGPPPLVVSATFFGYVTDGRTGIRRAFFSDGDDVYVVGIGDVLEGRFRLLDIGNSTAELEEVASGRKTTVTMTMEQPGSS